MGVAPYVFERRAQLKLLWEQGVPAEEIAERLGYSSAKTVRNEARIMGLAPRRAKAPDWSDEEQRLLEESVAAKMAIKDIAVKLGRSASCIGARAAALRAAADAAANENGGEDGEESGPMQRRCQAAGCRTIFTPKHDRNMVCPSCTEQHKPDVGGFAHSVVGSSAGMCLAA
jgi:hypothetical protein